MYPCTPGYAAVPGAGVIVIEIVIPGTPGTPASTRVLVIQSPVWGLVCNALLYPGYDSRIRNSYY
eukprot:3137452-Rhodomonas_salina.1